MTYLNVLAQIHITKQPKSIVTTEKEHVIFTATATGPANDHFTYKWVKEKGNLICNVTDEQYTPALTLLTVKPGDSGLYYCIVKNQWNMTKKSNVAFLKVICACT